MIQVENALNIFEAKYPYARGLFLFDNAPSHKKVADDQLDVDKMNVGVGGKQPWCIYKEIVHLCHHH